MNRSASSMRVSRMLFTPKGTMARPTGIMLAGASLLASTAIWAQTPGKADTVPEEVIITGTSIRGAAPVGTNLITIGRESIEESGAQTLQQIMSSVPAVTGFGNAAQGGFGSADGAGTFAPTIHGLGASASNGTLILIDGHRIPLTGINHTLADPGVIAPLAIERVEVLPEGASSTYGSDAVAGVLNFITRRNFNGFEASGQMGFGDSYKTQNLDFIWGSTWTDGSALLTYGFSHRSHIQNSDRSFTKADHTDKGGGNFAGTNCGSATVSAGGLNYTSPYTAGTGQSASIFCDYSGVADLIPENNRHNLLVKLTHDVNDDLKVSTDIVFSKQVTTAAIARGGIAVTATNANPFFEAPTGVTSATVRWQADDLLGPGAKNTGSAETFFVTFGAEQKLGGDWLGTFSSTIGKDDSRLRRDGALCTFCATSALAGTTTATALDVWGVNSTSAAVIGRLTDSTQVSQAHQTLKSFTLKFDGSLFSLPGGSVRAAVGAEYNEYFMKQESTTGGVTAPASSGSQTFFLDYARDVKSGFAEVQIPIVGDSNAMTGIQRLDVNVAGRYDKYSDFGSTTNPKLAVTWGINRSVAVRGNFAKSFTAPALTSRGRESDGTTGETGFGNFGVNPFVIPTSTYPTAVGGIPGCTAGATSCTLGNATATGIIITGGNKDLKAQKGKSFSFGIDFTPTFINGLTASATFWNAKINGGITAPVAGLAVNSTALSNLLTIYPGGATQAQIDAATAGRPQTSAYTNVYFIYDFRQRNVLNLDVNGIDAEVHYRFNTDIGEFTTSLSGSYKLKFDQQIGDGGIWFSVLNTTGFNGTFPSTKLGARLDLGWKHNNVSANLGVNHVGAYDYWGQSSGTGNAAWNINRQNGAPVSGGQPIGAQNIFDLHVGYEIKAEGWLSGTKLALDVDNLFDTDPEFTNVAAGFDSNTSNPIGRVISLGVRKKW